MTRTLFWQQFIGKYPPLFLRECTKAIELSEEVARKWLQGGGMTPDNDIMFIENDMGASFVISNDE